MCKQVGLEYDDVENMTIGACMDYIHEWVERNGGNKEEKTRVATQEDMDSF